MSFDLKSNINVKKTLISGTSWRGGAEAFRIGWNSVVVLILAALLDPAAFGLVGMTDVFVQFFNILMAMGFENAVIQQEKMNQRILSSLFWLNLILGVVLTAIGILIAPIVGWFYREDAVIPIFSVLSALFFLQSLSVVQKGLLGRDMAFRRLALVDVGATFIASLVAIGMARAGFSYWSLVALQLVKYLLMGCGYWYSTSWRPTFQVDWQESFDSLRFSWNLLIFNVLNFFATRSDIFLIGRLLGAEELGYYFLANRLIVRPIGQILTVISRTLFPVLAAIQSDPRRMRDIFNKTIYSTFAVLAPLIILAGLLSPIFIPTFLGDKWIPMIPIFMVWCIGSVRRIIDSRLGVIFLATGRPDLQWKYQLISTPVVIAALLVGVQWGALGASIGYIIAQFSTAFLAMYLAFRLIKLTIGTYYWQFRFPILSSILMTSVGGGLVWGGLSFGLNEYLIIGGVGVVATSLYILSLYVWDSKARMVFSDGMDWLRRRHVPIPVRPDMRR